MELNNNLNFAVGYSYYDSERERTKKMEVFLRKNMDSLSHFYEDQKKKSSVMTGFIVFYNIKEIVQTENKSVESYYHFDYLKAGDATEKDVEEAKKELFTQNSMYSNLSNNISKWADWLGTNSMYESLQVNRVGNITTLEDYQRLDNQKNDNMVTGRIVAFVIGHKNKGLFFQEKHWFGGEEMKFDSPPYYFGNEILREGKDSLEYTVSQYFLRKIEDSFKKETGIEMPQFYAIVIKRTQQDGVNVKYEVEDIKPIIGPTEKTILNKMEVWG